MSFFDDDDVMKLLTPEGQKALSEIKSRIRLLTEVAGGVDIDQVRDIRYNNYLVRSAIYRLIRLGDVYIQPRRSIKDSFAVYKLYVVCRTTQGDHYGLPRSKNSEIATKMQNQQ